MDISDVATVVEVQGLFARYAHHLDSGDFDAWEELFSEDAVLVMGDLERTGRAAIRKWLENGFTPSNASHAIVNVAVRPDGSDRATATADFLFSRRPDGEGGWRISMVGQYVDVFVQQDGRWLIHEHRIVPR